MFQTAVLFMIGLVSLPAWGQGKAPAVTLPGARQKYVGKKIVITGPLQSPGPALLSFYVNWRLAKLGTDGRYRRVSADNSSHLAFGYERHQANIIAIQLSDDQQKGPWTDILGKRHEEHSVSYDFVVKFDDNVIAMATSSLDNPPGEVQVVVPPTQKQE